MTPTPTRMTSTYISCIAKNFTSGEEVFLHYGDSFFSDQGDKKPKEVRVENMFELDQHSSDETYNE